VRARVAARRRPPRRYVSSERSTSTEAAWTSSAKAADTEQARKEALKDWIETRPATGPRLQADGRMTVVDSLQS